MDHLHRLINFTGFQKTTGDFKIPDTCFVNAMVRVWNMINKDIDKVTLH